MTALADLPRAVAAGDGPALLGRLRMLTDPDDLSFAVSEAVDIDDAQDFLGALVAAEPDDALPRLLQATHLTFLGWAARSAYQAQHVTAAQFTTMHDHLRRSERILLELIAIHPGYAPAWIARITNARGLEMGPSESLRRYRKAVTAAPHCYSAQSAHLQGICTKWGGSQQQMHEFARASAAAAPPGGPHGGLIAVAHVEHWLELPVAERDAYLRRPDVVAELAAAGASVTGYAGLRAPAVHQWFAMVFSLAGQRDAAAAHFRALDRFAFAPGQPWGYLGGDRAANYAKHRAKAGVR